MLLERRVVCREGRAAGTPVLPGAGDKLAKVLFVEEQVIAIDECLTTLHGKTLARLQFKLVGCIRGQDIPLMQPKGGIMDAEITGGFIKRRYGIRRVENDFEHMIYG
jgi:hypothetical protein